MMDTKEFWQMTSSLAAIVAICIAIITTNRNYQFSKSQMLLQAMSYYIAIRKDRTSAILNNEKESCKQYYREVFDLYWSEFNLWRMGYIDDRCMKIWMQQANKNNRSDCLIIKDDKETDNKIKYNTEWNDLKDNYFENEDPFRQFMDLVHNGKIEEAMNKGKKKGLIRKFIGAFNTKIYLAGPLFSLSEKKFNKELANELEKAIDNCFVILPQEYPIKNKGNTEEEKYKEIFNYCIDQIDKSDIIIAILEGPDVDSGTCIELGYAYSKKKRIVGIRTDFRSSEDKGVNLMVSNVCNIMITDTETESIEKLSNEIKESILVLR